MAPRPGTSGGVNKTPHRMKTRARARDAKPLKRRLNGLHAQSNEHIAKALESQTEEVEQRLQNPDITNRAGNEAQLKDLLNELNQLTEKEEAIQAQVKAADEVQQESEMDVDRGLGSDPPNFAQTREDNVPVGDSDDNSTPEDYAGISSVDLPIVAPVIRLNTLSHGRQHNESTMGPFVQ